MKKQDFINGLQEELELETVINSDTILNQIEEWDSMTAMMLIGYVSNEFGVTLAANDLEKITTIESLIQRIGLEKFE